MSSRKSLQAAVRSSAAVAAVAAVAAMAAMVTLAACSPAVESEKQAATQPAATQSARAEAPAAATFAGGCFWCMEAPFDELYGVISTTSGYTGGELAYPTYEQVSAGATGHYEAIQVVYDPKRIGYEKLLRGFWHNIDPTDPSGQFCDKGDQYRSAIFYHDETQKRLAEASRRALVDSRRFEEPVVTPILPAREFYPAEDYHQDFYRKNPERYRSYRSGCGRDHHLENLWGRSH